MKNTYNKSRTRRLAKRAKAAMAHGDARKAGRLAKQLRSGKAAQRG